MVAVPIKILDSNPQIKQMGDYWIIANDEGINQCVSPYNGTPFIWLSHQDAVESLEAWRKS